MVCEKFARRVSLPLSLCVCVAGVYETRVHDGNVLALALLQLVHIAERQTSTAEQVPGVRNEIVMYLLASV